MKKFILALLSFAAFAFMLAPALTGLAAAGIPAPLVLIGAAALAVGTAFVPSKITGVACGVEKENWVAYIIERFWKDNQFLKFCFDDDQYVIGGKIVHIPQPGTAPTVVKNRSSFPASVTRRQDTDITFALDVYTSDPTHIVDAEKKELSYDKQDSVMGDHAGALNQTVADDMIIKWMTGIPASSIVSASGTATTAPLPGQTGNRKTIVAADMRRARLALNKQDIPDDGERYALLDADQQDQLLNDLSGTQYRDFSQYADAKTGIIGKLFGFNILSRSSVAVMNSSGVVNPLGAALQATDNTSGILWHKNAVTRALGEVDFFENERRAEYYGDIYSALIRMGGRRRRADDKGVIALVSGT